MSDLWAQARYEIAAEKATTVDGFTYRGLGMHQIRRHEMFKQAGLWCLAHLNSGHAIVVIAGSVREAFDIATDIAECGEWDFNGLNGWENRDPELTVKLKAILDRHPDRVRGFGSAADHDMARKIGNRRDD